MAPYVLYGNLYCTIYRNYCKVRLNLRYMQLIVLIIDFTVVQIQDKFQIEFRHSSFYGVPDLKNVNSIDLEKRVLTKSVYFNCGTL